VENRQIVPADKWLAARKELLKKEKEFSRLRDEVTAARQALPWEQVETDYRFSGPDGEETLAQLFGDRSQLIVYHFMFEPDWNDGCKSCSFITDHIEPSIVHIAHRDVSLVLVSRAPLGNLEAFRQRMKWNLKWVSSEGSNFNRDFQVSFTPEEIEQHEVYYNYREGRTFPSTEGPGISAFYKDEAGAVYHTYSSYQRGLENFIGAYTLLDIVPMGRDESALPYGMEWLRLKDAYDEDDFVDPYADKLR
jgi:predicted dithiol-disulfide oxidoreductase (DUF899 family)